MPRAVPSHPSTATNHLCAVHRPRSGRAWSVGPVIESQQAAAEWAERRRFTPLLLDAARVTGKGITVWGRARGPRGDAASPRFLALLPGRRQRVHGDVLSQPGAPRGVSAVPMQKRRLPDSQLTGGQADLDDRMIADVGRTGNRTGLGPFIEEALLVAVDGGDALEATHVGGRVLQSENPLPPAGQQRERARRNRITSWSTCAPPDGDAFPGDPRRIEQQRGQPASLSPLGRRLLGLDEWAQAPGTS